MTTYTLGPLSIEAVTWDGTDDSRAAIQRLAASIDSVRYNGHLCPMIPPQWRMGIPARILLPADRGAVVVRLPWGIVIMADALLCALAQPVCAATSSDSLTDAHTSYAEQPCALVDGSLPTHDVFPCEGVPHED